MVQISLRAMVTVSVQAMGTISIQEHSSKNQNKAVADACVIKTGASLRQTKGEAVLTVNSEDIDRVIEDQTGFVDVAIPLGGVGTVYRVL